MKKRNIDVYRFIASLMIVAIHIYPLNSINKTIDYAFTRVLFRIAVPFFLMITGYFVLPKSLSDKNNLKKYLIKIAKIYCLSMLIYLPLNIYNHYFQNANILSIIKDIFLNGTFYHLWYFPALLLGIVLTYFLLKIKNNKLKITLFCLLYCIGLFGDSYYGLVKDIPFLNGFYSFLFTIFDYTRNGLFYAPIFLGIGYLISQKEPAIKKNTNVLFIIVFILMLLIEGMTLYHFNIPRHTSMYISLLPLSYTLFQLVIKNKETNKKLRNLSTWIYILHPFFIVVVRLGAKIIHLENIFVENSIIHYLAVVIATILFIKTVDFLKEKIVKK